MFVLGGLYSGNPSVCLDGGILQVFNLNTLRFQDSYNPNIYNDYEVPSLVTAQIGGKYGSIYILFLFNPLFCFLS